MKRMSRFLPTRRRPFEEAERHYLEIHHRFARGLFRHHAPTVQRYATARAVAQYDINGRFDQEPDVWRFIVLEFPDPSPAPGEGDTKGKEWLPAWAERLIVGDHTNFLREVRPFTVDKAVLVDRRSGQLTSAKFVFEFERTAADEARQRDRETIRNLLVEKARSAFGLRLFLENTVVSEAQMVEVFEPGQAYGGTLLEETTMDVIQELYFDHRDWGEEFFADPEVVAVLREANCSRIGGYRVEELVGVDRT